MRKFGCPTGFKFTVAYDVEEITQILKDLLCLYQS